MGLALGEVSLAVVGPSLHPSDEMEGINHPEKGHKEGIHEEHNCLFLDNSIRMCVVVLIFDCLNCEGHESSGKEQPTAILKCK